MSPYDSYSEPCKAWTRVGRLAASERAPARTCRDRIRNERRRIVARVWCDVARALRGIPVAVVAVVFGAAQPVRAQCAANELLKITASDAAPGDQFAKSVSVTGSVAVVKNYVYRFDGVAWSQEAELTPPDGAPAGAGFGRAVAVSDDVAVIAWGTHALVYRFDGMDWVNEATLDPFGPSAGATFGDAVSVSGNVVIVGDPSTLIQDTGQAWVYRFDGKQWVEEVRLVASDGDQQDRFGNAVSVRGDLALIGASNEGNTGVPWGGTGAAYLYRYDPLTLTWTEQTKFTSPDPVPGELDQFGRSVAIRSDENVLVIGTEPLVTGGPVVPVGAAYVFRFDPEACTGMDCVPWINEGKLVPADAAGGDRFGYSVSISGDIIVAGAWGVFDDACPFPMTCHAGAAYVFRYDGVDWIEQAKLASSDIENGDLLGWSVSISGDTAFIGAWRDGDGGADSGSAYVFRGLSDCNLNATLDLCDIVDGTSDDANANGVADECEVIAIVSSDPSDGAIDARQPSAPDGTNPDGWGSIVLTFAGDASDLTPEDFSVVPDLPNAVPFDVTVKPDGDTATLTFLDADTGAPAMIPPGAWTVITHLPSASTTRVGYLPADVNNDRLSNANDILTLIDDLNGVTDPPLADYQTDIDRSGASNASDILRVIDLLNGAEAYDVWNGAALPP
ncbi:MAG: hypothetical protein ACE5E6_04430 [Phycisphaerae bacterium]